MLSSQQFCVKWNSYSSNLQSVFPRLLNSEHFVDITLACEGQMIKCHKVVLSACSTYFEKLLVQNPCQHPIIFMKDMKHWEVQALVDFMYKGEVNVSQEELNSLLVAAEALQIRGLCGLDNTTRPHEGIRQPTSPLSKIPSVSLPNDIVLSGGTSLGHESPPQKKRKIPNDEKEQSLSSLPRISGVSSLSNNQPGTDTNASAPPALGDPFRTEDANEDNEEELGDKKIKQEVETEDSFFEGEGDIDVKEEEGAVEPQEDSDSNTREEVHSNTLLDQPGPSGIATTGTAEKAATGGRWAGPLSTLVSTEVDHCGLPTLQHLSSFNQSQLLEIPFASSWRGNVAPTLKHFSNQPQLSGHSGKLYSDIASIEHGQIRVRECFPSSVQLESRLHDSEVGINRPPILHFPPASSSGSGLDQIGSVRDGPHSVRPMEVNMIARSALMNDRSRDLLLDSSCQVRQHRISRRHTEEEKALRKLEMARLRQRRFRAKIRLMREAGLPVIKRERKRKVVSDRAETDNTQS